MYLTKCDILPKIHFKTVNSKGIFSLKCRQITNYASARAFASSDERVLSTILPADLNNCSH